MTRFTLAVQHMGMSLRRQCAGVTMALAVLNEDEQPNASDAVRGQLAAMVALCKQSCDAYNKLRSRVAEMERANGVKEPTFYVKEYVETGEPKVASGHCTCGCLCSVVDLAALNPANNNLADPDEVLADTEGQDGG